MCFIFSDRFEMQAALLASTDYISPDEFELVLRSTEDAQPSVIPSKRPASSSLENGTKKAARISGNNDAASEPDRSVTSELLGSRGETLTNLTEKLGAATVEIMRLKGSVEELQEERNEYRLRAVQSERLQKETGEKLQAATRKNQTAVLEDTKLVENEIKEKSDKKVHDLKKQYDKKLQVFKDKLQQTAKEKEDKRKNKIDDFKKKHVEEQAMRDKAHEEKIKESKGKDRERQQELKDLKAEHQKVQKQLKEEQKAKIKTLKPEHSKAVKEKSEALKSIQAENRLLQNAINQAKDKNTKLEETVESLEDKNNKLEDELKSQKGEVKHLKGIIVTREGCLDQWKQAHADLQVAHNAKLEEEGRKWQVQHDKAESYCQELTSQRRTNFVLRNGMDRKDGEIADVRKELSVARERVGISRCGVKGGDVVDDALGAKLLGDWSAAAATLAENSMEGSGGTSSAGMSCDETQLLGDWSARPPA